MKRKQFGFFLAACILATGMHGVITPAKAADDSIMISIDQVSVSMQELEAADYEIPVLVHLKQNGNASLNAIEFGLEVDKHCRFETLTRNIYTQAYQKTMHIEMSSSPDVSGCTWLTWAKKDAFFQENSDILMLLVKIPENAGPSDHYDIRYLTQSSLNAEKSHIWYCHDTMADYTLDDIVTWTDGWIEITDEEEPPLRGDVTLDGVVDIMDVITVNQSILGKTQITDRQAKAADINQDGVVEPSDSLNIMKLVVGLPVYMD